MAEGILVKVSCLGPVGETKIGGASEVLDTAEGERTAEEIAAAASAETVRPELQASFMYSLEFRVSFISEKLIGDTSLPDLGRMWQAAIENKGTASSLSGS